MMAQKEYQKRGYVYVLSNPSMPGIVKIGRSVEGGKHRARQIYTTGVPTPFEVQFEILVSEPEYVERAAHDRLAKYRENGSREFFRCEVDEAALAIADCWAGIMDHTVVSLDLSGDTEELYALMRDLRGIGVETHNVPLFRAIMSEITPEIAAAFLRNQDERIEKIRAAGGFTKYREMMDAQSTKH
jgi:hypothetical protein